MMGCEGGWSFVRFFSFLSLFPCLIAPGYGLRGVQDGLCDGQCAGSLFSLVFFFLYFQWATVAWRVRGAGGVPMRPGALGERSVSSECEFDGSD